MKVKEANSGLLCNFEVLDLLRSRGANQEDLASFGTVTPSECKVYDYLVQMASGTQTRDVLTHFIDQIDQYKLTKGEKLQAINLRPSSAVEVHLIVEDCEERMTAEAVEQFLGTVSILPPPPEKPEEEAREEDEEDAADDGDGGADKENDDENGEADEGDDAEEMEE